MIKFLDALSKELSEVHSELESKGYDNADPKYPESPIFYGNDFITVENLQTELEKNLESLNDTLTSIDHFLFERHNHPERG
tara:strand:- start:11 stop:253 length:243 start_codon:yes stop_codon:yes gene_type:complete